MQANYCTEDSTKVLLKGPMTEELEDIDYVNDLSVSVEYFKNFTIIFKVRTDSDV